MAVTLQQNTSGKQRRLANLTNAGKGRAKGVHNKTTMLAKEAIAIAGEMLGGADRLFAWCKENELNERVFWGTIYPKLLPLQVHGPDDAAGNPMLPVIEIRLIAPVAS